MKSTIQFKTAIRSLLTTLAFVCFALLPGAQAVVPAPDGGYPGGNTAEGQNALLSLTSGIYNTTVGIYSALSLTDGNFCTGVGAGALLANTADSNTATGARALLSNTTASGNTANGTFALFSNTTGVENVAVGFEALFNNTTIGGNFGRDNTAVGYQALLSNTIGPFNTAHGSQTLFSNTTGSQNTATGAGALFNNDTGNNNTALGFQAGLQQHSGSGNVYIGAGMLGVAGENNACYIASIFGQTIDPATAIIVGIDANNKLGTIASSKRFKQDIKPMDKASEAILALKPVTFHYKSDAKGTPCFGLIAEEVAEVNPGLVVRDNKGEIYTVRYEAVNAMLLNEFLKEHRRMERQDRRIQEQEATVADLESTMAQQRKDFDSRMTELKKEIETVVAGAKEQDSKIEKVSAEIDLRKPVTRMALSNP
jgi:hypothetical protein